LFASGTMLFLLAYFKNLFAKEIPKNQDLLNRFNASSFFSAILRLSS